MIRSLLLKLGMLAATIGIVWWIVWQMPDDFGPDPSSGEEPSSATTMEASGQVAQAVQELSPVEKEARSAGVPLPDTTQVQARPTRRSVSLIPPVLSTPVDLNRADAKTLESLPGIGVVLAQRVIDYRTARGRFQTIDDLRAVKGIGPKTLERLKPLVMISGEKQTGEMGEQPS